MPPKTFPLNPPLYPSSPGPLLHLFFCLASQNKKRSCSSTPFHSLSLSLSLSPQLKKIMGSFSYSFFRLKNTIFFRISMILFLSSITHRMNLCSNLPLADPSLPNLGSSYVLSSLKTIHLDGHFNFDNIYHAANDFGNRHHYLPSAILHPKSVSDISSTIKHIFEMGPATELTIAARGHGHSVQGQAQAHRGVVVNMESLQAPKTIVHTGKMPYADVSGGELWINILHESLKHGLAPKSWTDYLHLTVGGTLSNAGISGQAFRHGPQINNVYQLEVVTGIFKQIFRASSGTQIYRTICPKP